MTNAVGVKPAVGIFPGRSSFTRAQYEGDDVMKILVVCNGGMSSSILEKKMRDAAAKRGLDVTVSARSNNGLGDEAGKWDVCLVGPQIMYAVASIEKVLGIPTASVDARVYAMADGEKAIDQALTMLKK